jgi:hypothetical protein
LPVFGSTWLIKTGIISMIAVCANRSVNLFIKLPLHTLHHPHQ